MTYENIDIESDKDYRTLLGKEKYMLPEFTPFPIMFSKELPLIYHLQILAISTTLKFTHLR